STEIPLQADRNRH
ncbi:unnamed protein product, partial [Rotaria magnacalcarata]